MGGGACGQLGRKLEWRKEMKEKDLCKIDAVNEEDSEQTAGIGWDGVCVVCEREGAE